MPAFHLYALFRGAALGLYVPIYLIFLNDHHCAPLHIGLLGTFFELVKCVVAIPNGRFTDHYGAKWPLILSGVIGGVLWLFFIFGSHTLTTYYILTGLLGISEACLSGSVESWITTRVTKETIATIILHNSRMMILAIIIAGLFSGWLYEQSPLFCFVLLSTINIGKAIIAAFGIDTRPSIQEKPLATSYEKGDHTFIKALIIAMRCLYRVQVLRTLAFSLFFVTMACDMALRYYELYLNQHGFGATYTGCVFGYAAALALCILFLVKRYERMVAHCSLWIIAAIDIVGAVVCFLLITSRKWPIVNLILLLSLEDIRSPIAKTLLTQELYDFKHKALVFSLFTSLESTGEIFAGTLFGYIIGAYGLHMGFAISILFFILSAICCLLGRSDKPKNFHLEYDI